MINGLKCKWLFDFWDIKTWHEDETEHLWQWLLSASVAMVTYNEFALLMFTSLWRVAEATCDDAPLMVIVLSGTVASRRGPPLNNNAAFDVNHHATPRVSLSHPGCGSGSAPPGIKTAEDIIWYWTDDLSLVNAVQTDTNLMRSTCWSIGWTAN